MDEELKQYRASLVATLQVLNQGYDTMLVTLSGGALGLSMVFLKDGIGPNGIQCRELLLLSWVAFALSLAAALGRVLFGIEAHQRAIQQVDDGRAYSEPIGGWATTVTRVVHLAGGGLLIAGLLSLTLFAFINLR